MSSRMGVTEFKQKLVDNAAGFEKFITQLKEQYPDLPAEQDFNVWVDDWRDWMGMGAQEFDPPTDTTE